MDAGPGQIEARDPRLAGVTITGGNSPTDGGGIYVPSGDLSLSDGPWSVMDKQHVPPSGDKHDYMSLGPYWWPDPDKPDGLPYIRRDGEVVESLRGEAEVTVQPVPNVVSVQHVRAQAELVQTMVHGVGQRAQAGHVNVDDVAGLQVHRRRARMADA